MSEEIASHHERMEVYNMSTWGPSSWEVAHSPRVFKRWGGVRQASSWVSLRGTLALRYWLHSCDPHHLQKGHVSEYESLCSTCTGAGFDMSIWGGHKCSSHRRDRHTSAMIYSLQWEVSTFALTLSAHRPSYGAGTPHPSQHPLISGLFELFSLQTCRGSHVVHSVSSWNITNHNWICSGCCLERNFLNRRSPGTGTCAIRDENGGTWLLEYWWKHSLVWPVEVWFGPGLNVL